MRWVILAIILRGLTHPRIWRLYCRWLPVGEYGATPLTLKAIHLYTHTNQYAHEWLATGQRKGEDDDS